MLHVRFIQLKLKGEEEHTLAIKEERKYFPILFKHSYSAFFVFPSTMEHSHESLSLHQ